MKKHIDAFISYGRADSKEFAATLQSNLDDRGFKVWFDFNDIPLGVDFQNQIDDGIEKASHFLYLISPHSVNSAYCLKEIELAIQLNKRIIPLLHVEAITRETWQQRNQNGTDEEWEAYQNKGLHSSFPNMHPAIGKINWVYFREGIDDFKKSLSDLIGLLHLHRDYVQKHTYFLIRSLEWKRHHKRTNYLLTGEDKQEAQDWLKFKFKTEQPPCLPSDLHCEYITESIKNGNNLMTQVFLSYPSQDKEMMEKIRNGLMRESITVWTNTTDIQTGEAFGAAIDRGIEQADNLVYLLSPDSLNSIYCQQELALAVSLNKRIVPMLVRETDPELVPSGLRNLQYIDLTDNVKEKDYLLDENELLKILRQDATYYNEHKILLTKALKWKRQNENPSILLRGYNLRSAEAWLKVAQKRTQHPPMPLQEEFITQSLQQPPLESLDVFVSYSRADSDFARELNDRLQMQGKTTWFDQESIASGSDFQQEIYRGIKACDNFLFVLSPKSVNSPYCADEVEYAASLNKRFVTLRYREVNPADLHPELAKVQWIDFHQNDEDFNASFNSLVRTLDTDREHVHSHTKWLQRALDWEQKGRSDDLLLRGSEFAIAQNWLSETEKKQKKPAAAGLQQEFIEASRKAIAAAEEEEKRRQAEMLHLQEERTKEAVARLAEQQKSVKRQKFFLAAVSTALVAAVGLGAVAVRLWQRAAKVTEGQVNALSRFSLEQAKSDRKFDAIVEGIRAKDLLKNLTTVTVEIKEPVKTALQAAVYGEGFRERNRIVERDNAFNSIALSPDGEIVVSAGTDKTVKLWRRDGKLLQTLSGHTDIVTSVAISPDGGTIASGSEDKTVKLWNWDGKLLQTLALHEAPVRSLAFSPDGEILASGSWDKTIKLWNRDGELLQTLALHEESINSLAFSPDGETLASGSEDKTIKLWNRNGELLQTLSGHEKSLQSLAFSPDGETLATGSWDQTIKLWNRDGKLLQTLSGHEDWVNSLAFSPDGETIASGSKDKTIKLWNRDGELLQTLALHEDWVNSIAFAPQSPDNRSDELTLVSASWDRTARFWNRNGGVLPTLSGHRNVVMSVAVSPDGETIASGGWDKTIKLWNRDGELLQTIDGNEGEIASLVFSPDGETIASSGWDNTIKLWNRNGKLLQNLKAHEQLVTRIVFSPDGETIASGSFDNTIKLWSRDGELLQTFQGDESGVNSVAFSPDGDTIASAGGDNTVKLWSRDGKLRQTLQGHEASVLNIAFSPDGETIASASSDNTIKLWSREGERLHILRGHQGAVNSVAVSPDGETIASGDGEGIVKLWNRDGELLQTLWGHQSGVNSIAFTPDGGTIVSGSTDNTAILWNLDDLTLDVLARDACDRVGNYLRYHAPQRDRHLCQDVAE